MTGERQYPIRRSEDLIKNPRLKLDFQVAVDEIEGGRFKAWIVAIKDNRPEPKTGEFGQSCFRGLSSEAPTKEGAVAKLYKKYSKVLTGVSDGLAR